MKDVFENHINLLGLKARDKITGFTGVVDSIAFDLYGCIQATLKPPITESGEIPDGHWFDVNRLEILDKDRVVDLPDFHRGYVASGRKGPTDKPKL